MVCFSTGPCCLHLLEMLSSLAPWLSPSLLPFYSFILSINKYALSADSVPGTVSRHWKHANGRTALRPHPHGVYLQVPLRLLSARGFSVATPRGSARGVLLSCRASGQSPPAGLHAPPPTQVLPVRYSFLAQPCLWRCRFVCETHNCLPMSSCMCHRHPISVSPESNSFSLPALPTTDAACPLGFCLSSLSSYPNTQHRNLNYHLESFLALPPSI